MSSEARATRRERRSAGKRELRREARQDVLKIIELSEQGYSAGAIAATVGLSRDFCALVLRYADEFQASDRFPEEEGGGGNC